jgi:GT2 family glycosyltransferase
MAAVNGRGGVTGTGKPVIDVSVVVVSWNTSRLLKDCLTSLFANTKGIAFEVILVDNASSDDSVEMVRRDFPSVNVIVNSENRGFVKANNQAFGIARGRYFLLLNSDTIVLDQAIPKTLGYADEHPRGAVFGCKVLNPDRSIQRTCFMWPSPLNMLLQSTYLYKVFPKSRFFGREFMTWWDHSEEREVETISGCFSLVRRSAIDSVGPMDPVYFFYGDDPDWCRRFAKAGWEIRYFPGASIIHFGGQSTGIMRRAFRLQLAGSQLIFNRLHRNYLSFLADKFFSAQFFLLRIPYWLAKAALDPKNRKSHRETAGTCLVGAALCLFDWKALVMNRAELESRLAAGKKAKRTDSATPASMI